MELLICLLSPILIWLFIAAFLDIRDSMRS